MIASIIIPTFNEEQDISFCIRSLQKQSFKNFEIIVVDDGSTDNTLSIIKKFNKIRKLPKISLSATGNFSLSKSVTARSGVLNPDLQIKILKQNHRGPGEGRNLGASIAKGRFLVFVDADMTFEKDYLKNLLNPLLSNKELIGTTHDKEVAINLKNIWSRCIGKIRVSRADYKNLRVFRAIRRDIFLRLGGFERKYGYSDDQTFFFRDRLRPIFANNTICYHKNPTKLVQIYNHGKWIASSYDNYLLEIPIFKYFIPFLLITLSPMAIPLIWIKRAIKLKDRKIFFPWLLIFTSVRYLAAAHGIFNKIYFNKNVI